MPSDPPSTRGSAAPRIVVGVPEILPDALLSELTQRGIAVRVIPEDTDPSAEIDVVVVLQAPSSLIGRCRGRWPVLVAVDDPRASDVSRLLRSGATDVVRRPLRADDLADRIRRAKAKHESAEG